MRRARRFSILRSHIRDTGLKISCVNKIGISKLSCVWDQHNSKTDIPREISNLMLRFWAINRSKIKIFRPKLDKRKSNLE